MRCRSFLALLSLVLVPLVSVAAKPLSPLGGAENDPQGTETPATDTASFTYLGSTYVTLPGCYGTAFVVGIEQTTLGQTDKVLTALPFPGGVTVIPPRDVAATGTLAAKAVGDAACLDLVSSPAS